MDELDPKKLENLQKLLAAFDTDRLTTADFMDAFKKVVEHVQNTQQLTVTHLQAITTAVQQAVENLSKGNEAHIAALKEELLSTFNSKGTELDTSHQDALARLEAAIAGVTNGKDADEDLIVKKVLSKLPAPEANFAEDIRNKLEMLEGEDRLDSSAIRGLPELEAKVNSSTSVIGNNPGTEVATTAGNLGRFQTLKFPGATVTTDNTTASIAFSGSGTVTSVTSADTNATVATTTTTPVITIVSAPKWAVARTLAGNSVDGSANVAFANKFIVQGTADPGLSAAQFLGALGTGIVKNTTTTGVLSIATGADLPVMTATVGGAVPTPPNNTTTFLRGDGTFATPPGTGTVTSVSVVPANGFAGTVATATTTPAITLTTSISGLLKGNATAISAATSGTDYSAGTSALGTGILKSTTITGALTIAVAGDFPTLNQDTTGKSAKTDALNSATTVINVSSATAPTTGQVLTATSGTAATWQTPSTGFANPMTTVGDIIYEGTGPTPARLAGNTTAAKQFLTQTGTGTISAAPAWAAIVAGDVPTLNQNTTGSAASFTGSLVGDVTGTQGATVVGKINGVSLAGLTTGILKNTTTTGVPSIAIAADFPTLNQNTTGTAAGLSATLAVASGGTGITSFGTGIATWLGTPSSANLAAAITDETGSGALVFGTSPTLSTPVLNGTPTGTGVATAATVSTLALRDASGNLNSVNFIEGATVVTTAAGTTTLTVGSNAIQVFGGTTTQTVVMPVTSTLVVGQQWYFINLSTGAVTVNSSGGNTILILASATAAVLTCTTASGTTNTSWTADYKSAVAVSGKKASINNSLTFAGTDGTTMTFPSTSATIARTDAANTFTGHQTIEGVTSTGATGTGNLVFATSPTLTTPVISSITNTGTITLPTSTDTLVGRATTDTLTNKTLTTPIIQQINSTTNNPIKLNAGSYTPTQSYSPAAAATATLDLSLGNAHFITMPAGNITVALSNATIGQVFLVRIVQDATGSRTVTWFTTIKWAGGSAPTLTTTASKADMLGFVCTGSGAYDGFVVGQNI